MCEIKNKLNDYFRFSENIFAIEQFVSNLNLKVNVPFNYMYVHFYRRYIAIQVSDCTNISPYV